MKLQKTFADSPKSWSVDAKTIDQTTFDLSVKNPNGGEEVTHRSPQEIMDEIAALDAESAEVLEHQGAVKTGGSEDAGAMLDGGSPRLGEMCTRINMARRR